MADVNKVILIGRLTRDPQLRYIPSSNTPVCDFGFAVGRKYKTASGEQREESTFIDCSLMGRGAEIFNQYTSKGKQCYLEGRLRLEQWEDKNGGGKRSKLSVVVENFQFLGDRGGAGGGGGGGGGGGYEGGGEYEGSQQAPRQQSRPPQNRPQQSQPQAPYDDNQGAQFAEDDIPF